MSRPAPDQVAHVVSLGAGPIGAGWTAHFLARGYDVTAYLHSLSEERVFRKILDTAWISLGQSVLPPVQRGPDCA
jgi:carnitine 3-dehydrogenase